MTDIPLTDKEMALVRKVQALNGAKGGNKTKERHGKEHFVAMSNKRWGNK